MPWPERPQAQRSTLFAVAALGLAIFAAVIMVATRTRFRLMTAEFELPLSPMTSFVLGPVLPILLAVVVVATIPMEFIPQFRRIANLWNAGVFALASGCLGLYAVGVFLPLMTLIKGLS